MDSTVLIPTIKGCLILVLIYLAIVDWNTFRLPNVVTLPLIGAGLLFNFISELRFITPEESLIGASLGYGFIWMLNYVYRLVKNRAGIGMGDAKLLAGLGAWLGWVPLPNILLMASIAGLIGGLAWLTWNKQKIQQAFPFGPYLVIAGIIELIWPQFIPIHLLPKII